MMQHIPKTPSVSDLKDLARRLRQAMAQQGTPVTHSQSLELLALQYGLRDWNTLRAQAATPGPVVPQVGAAVSGRYMGQPFTGVLKAIARLGQGTWRVSVQLDAPVDVVSFDSFSSWRHRVSGMVDHTGRSLRHRSDGTPHLELEWPHG